MQGIIFDFDDTLVEATVFFDRAKASFAQKMAELGFPAEEALVVLNRFDIRNVLNAGGFLPDCFPRALAETYEHYCAAHNSPLCAVTRNWMEELGWQVFKQPVEVIEGAPEVLEALAKRYPLFLATKGEPEMQLARLEDSGLKQYFEQVYVVPDKTPAEYRMIAGEQGLVTGRSWVIGNSMKGDINPGILSGFNCIYVHHQHTWDFEDEPAVSKHHAVEDIREVPKIILAANDKCIRRKSGKEDKKGRLSNYINK